MAKKLSDTTIRSYRTALNTYARLYKIYAGGIVRGDMEGHMSIIRKTHEALNYIKMTEQLHPALIEYRPKDFNTPFKL